MFMVILGFDLSISSQAVKGMIIEEEIELPHFIYISILMLFSYFSLYDVIIMVGLN